MDLKEYISSGTLELYIAGVLPPEEMEEVTKMASLYPEIGEELRKIETVVEAYVVTHAKTPRPELKNRILDAIDKEAATAPKAMTPAAPATAVVRTIHTSTSSAFRYLAAACIILLLASNAIFIMKWKDAEGQLSSLISQNYQLSASYNQVKETYNRASSDLAIATNPEFKQIPMKGLPIAPASLAVVYWNPSTKEAFVDSKGLPTPQEGKQYQLWALVDGKPVDAGVFDASVDRNALQKVKLVADAQAFAVTLEPKGGSASPTLDQMYVMAKI